MPGAASPGPTERGGAGCGSWPGCAAPPHHSQPFPEHRRNFNFVSLLSQSLLALCALLHWEMSQLHISFWPKCPALPAMLCFPLPFSRTPFLLSFQTGFISGWCKDNPQLHGLQTPIPGAEQPPNPLRLQGFHPSPRCCSPKGPTPPQQSFWAPSPVPWNEPALAPLEMEMCAQRNLRSPTSSNKYDFASHFLREEHISSRCLSHFKCFSLGVEPGSPHTSDSSQVSLPTFSNPTPRYSSSQTNRCNM